MNAFNPRIKKQYPSYGLRPELLAKEIQEFLLETFAAPIKRNENKVYLCFSDKAFRITVSETNKERSPIGLRRGKAISQKNLSDNACLKK